MYSLSPAKSGYFGVFLACFLSPEMIVNIIEDEYGLIFTFTLFGFLHFWPFFAVFWPFSVILGFWWIYCFFGVVMSYKIT